MASKQVKNRGLKLIVVGGGAFTKEEVKKI